MYHLFGCISKEFEILLLTELIVAGVNSLICNFEPFGSSES